MRFAGTQLSNFMGDTTDFSLIAGTSSNGRRMEREAAMRGEGLVASSGIQGMGKVKSSEFQADAIEAEGAAQGQSYMASGLGNMFSGLAGGIIGRSGGKAATMSNGSKVNPYSPTSTGLSAFGRTSYDLF